MLLPLLSALGWAIAQAARGLLNWLRSVVWPRILLPLLAALRWAIGLAVLGLVNWLGPDLGHRLFLRFMSALRWAAVIAALWCVGWLAALEARSSYVQSRIFTALTRDMSFALEPGPSSSIRFPKHGPYDERLGYAEMPAFLGTLEAHHFAVDRQARWSPRLDWFVDRGGNAIFGEKSNAGLQLFDHTGAPLYRASYPQRTYANFDAIPPLVGDSLVFVEDQYLLDFESPRRDPAIEWSRFGLAAAGRLAGMFDKRFREGGASTLATQIEKFRHSPDGLTPAIKDKLLQMASAAARAYRNGPDTRDTRQQIMLAYLNSTPLGSQPGYGEIIGVPEALWAWFGTTPEEADRVLNGAARTSAEMTRKGEIYRQALSLLLAGRRPAYYLTTNRAALETLVDRYLRLLANTGAIDPELRDVALEARLQFRSEFAPAPPISYVGHKATDWLRAELMTMLHLPDLYALDRLDMTARASVDSAAQQRIADVLSRLGDPGYVRSLGLVGKQLLGSASPKNVAWSFVLYERGADRNYVRVHADSLNEPFDINSGAKLQLGSTAKLRTMISYLNIISELRDRFQSKSRQQLRAVAAAEEDPLTRWAADYLANASDRRLKAMLDAAMQRSYSASPESFFTGGGVQSFANFEKWENGERPSVEVAFRHSINLAFVRLMRDIVQYYVAQADPQARELLKNPDDPAREAYLHRFAEKEGQRYLARFYKDYQGRTGEEALDMLAQRTRPAPKRLAAVFRTVMPDAPRLALGSFLAAHLRGVSIGDDELWDLYRDYTPGHFSLPDLGYIAGVHPLELWLVTYLQQHPDATREQVVAASEQARQEVYQWLFNGSIAKQDLRIRILLEQDAFDRLLQDWRRLGYPFGHIVPSYGTAIGSSGDRPDALANLMGIVLNDGVRLPTVDLEHLEFAKGTPYETELSAKPEPERVMAPEVAQEVRRALLGVVADGTAARLNGAYRSADGGLLPVGGKTGTGDNRRDRFGRGGVLISQRVVDRTATFVFFLGDRFFGTVTAYVPGAIAAQYQFTSALAVQLLKSLQPQLEPLLHAPSGEEAATPVALGEIPASGSSTPRRGGGEISD